MRRKLPDKKILLASVIIAMLLLSAVPPAFASSSWSKPRPSEYTVYNETVGNANNDSECWVGLGVEICDYIPNTDGIDYDTLRLKVSVSANTRKSIEYGVGLCLRREYGWYEVSKPTNITGDNDGTPLDMFTLLYYGVEYQKIWVCSNGFITLNKTSTSPNPQSIPNMDEPNPIIAAFWRDLHPENGGSITYDYVDGNPGWFVVSWNEVPDDDGVPQTFQIVIENRPGGSLGHNRIYFQYKNITKNRYTVVGVEDQTGSRGDFYNYNDLQNELILECSYSALGYRLARLKISLTKSDSYAEIDPILTKIGGYNVMLETYENPYGEAFVETITYVANLALPAMGLGGLALMLDTMVVVPEVAALLAGELSNASFAYAPAGPGDNEAYVASDCVMEDRAAVKPYDASLGGIFEWIFNDDDTEDHSLTVTAKAWYEDQMLGDVYTVSTSATLNMEIERHTLSISAESGGTTDPAPGSYMYNWDTEVEVKAIADSGYDFDYWILDGATKYVNPITVTMDSDHNLKAYFVEESDGGGGGGCPLLTVYDGTEYVEEGLLDIHNPDGIDVITSHVLIHTPEPVEHRYLMRLTEHPQTHSHIDQVQLFATLEDGTEIKLPLVSAVHSEDGNVLQALLLSDDVRADTLGADQNNGTSEYIDLEFVAPEGLEILEFRFVIEGHNLFLKTLK